MNGGGTNHSFSMDDVWLHVILPLVSNVSLIILHSTSRALQVLVREYVRLRARGIIKNRTDNIDQRTVFLQMEHRFLPTPLFIVHTRGWQVWVMDVILAVAGALPLLEWLQARRLFPRDLANYAHVHDMIILGLEQLTGTEKPSSEHMAGLICALFGGCASPALLPQSVAVFLFAGFFVQTDYCAIALQLVPHVRALQTRGRFPVDPEAVYAYYYKYQDSLSPQISLRASEPRLIWSRFDERDFWRTLRYNPCEEMKSLVASLFPRGPVLH